MKKLLCYRALVPLISNKIVDMLRICLNLSSDLLLTFCKILYNKSVLVTHLFLLVSMVMISAFGFLSWSAELAVELKSNDWYRYKVRHRRMKRRYKSHVREIKFGRSYFAFNWNINLRNRIMRLHFKKMRMGMSFKSHRHWMLTHSGLIWNTAQGCV